MVMLATLLQASAVLAHHSIGMIDISTPIWVKGTVVRYQPINPHALVTVEERRADGQVHRLLVEGPIQNRLKRMGVGDDFLKAGDVIEICGFAFKADIAKSRVLHDPDGTTLAALHAHLLVMPDGHMRLFGAYGKLDNCIRPADPVQRWVDLLDADPLAQEAWCRRNIYSRTSIAPGAFVDEVDRRMANQCK